ncbi:MAG TPA: asparagine synthase-related protein [Mobilitalea sp.]|nr:asparagine synthase-related protein [Mobilitalea sp.]
MSAIWGMIDLLNSTGCEDIAIRMEKPYQKCKIDAFHRIISDNAVFGYGGQYFTKESRNEIMPITDKSNSFFTADVVLDNREELFDMLGIGIKDRDGIADGTLMYRIFCKYGKKSFLMFLGAYAFAYYDRSKNEILLVTDAVGSRCLYYYYDQGRLYFSTLMRPIIDATMADKEWNYRFLSDFLALNSLALYTEAEETPYKKIYKVAPGQVVRVGVRGVTKEDYWKPHLKKPLIKKSDEEYKGEFIKLFKTCVSSMMRYEGKTGILLSGGLDSTSVACFAAPRLKEKGEMLYSYTSVPEEDAVTKADSYYIVNEKEQVEATKKHLGNLSCCYLDLPGINGFDGALEYMNKLELPYKSLQNIRWIYACVDKAAKDGCRTLLTGKFGNTTISFGGYSNQLYALLRTGHCIELVKEINAFAKKQHIGRRVILRYLAGISKTRVFKKKTTMPELFQGVYVNSELLKYYDTGKRFHKRNRMRDKILSVSGRVKRPDIAYKPIFVQLGEFETHLSLDTGVLQRDPTRDRRLIEFCLALPDNQFVYRGVERRLVREYLQSYLPKEIIEDSKHRGLQSADMVNRISKNWERIYQECTDIMNHKIAEKLLDLPKLELKLNEYKEKFPYNEEFELMKLLYSILLVEYVS